jgi:hypothetical protein
LFSGECFPQASRGSAAGREGVCKAEKGWRSVQSVQPAPTARAASTTKATRQSWLPRGSAGAGGGGPVLSRGLRFCEHDELSGSDSAEPEDTVRQRAGLRRERGANDVAKKRTALLQTPGRQAFLLSTRPSLQSSYVFRFAATVWRSVWRPVRLRLFLRC